MFSKSQEYSLLLLLLYFFIMHLLIHVLSNAEHTHSDIVGIDVVWTRNIRIHFPDFNTCRVDWKHKVKTISTQQKLLVHNKKSTALWDHTRFCPLPKHNIKAVSHQSKTLHALLRPLCCLFVSLSTGSWRGRKWQAAVWLTGEDILVSVFTLVFWLLAFFPGIQQFTLLLLKYLKIDSKTKRNTELGEVSNKRKSTIMELKFKGRQLYMSYSRLKLTV